jgi:(2R)-ethylmalonyl-CoA mutase
MKRALVASHAERQRRIESGDLTMVGVNKFTEHEPSGLVTADAESILVVDADAERQQIERLRAFRAGRNQAEASAALQGLADAAKNGSNVMPASIRAAQSGVTTGEWSDALRKAFGEYRAPTGLQGATFSSEAATVKAVHARAQVVAKEIGHPIRLLVAKPGLDGHSNGAEQIAVRAKEVGFEVIYDGIRLTPEQIVASALEEDVDAIGLSIHSGSHMTLIPKVTQLLKEHGLIDVPVVLGGIIPEADHAKLAACGIAGIYTPGQKTLTEIIADIVELVGERRRPVAA